MKLVRVISMYSDHGYYGNPIECATVELYCDESLPPEHVEFLNKQQEKRMHSMAKQMPHRYWKEQMK